MNYRKSTTARTLAQVLAEVTLENEQDARAALDALVLNIHQDATLACEMARARGENVNDGQHLMSMAAQLAQRLVARARRLGWGDGAAIAEMRASVSPQLRAIGEAALLLRRPARWGVRREQGRNPVYPQAWGGR